MSPDPQARADAFPLRRSAHDPAVAYGELRAAEPNFWVEVGRLLASPGQRVCDIGGGAKPILSRERVAGAGVSYLVYDVSQEQLERAPAGLQTFCGDILDPASVSALAHAHGPFDAVITRWTAEHMRDGRTFHEHVFELLRPGGRALHLFPTLYSLPFLVNGALEQERSAALLGRVFPGRKVKFPAYYSWCRGPSEPQLMRLRGLGYEIERYVGFFGHGYYRRVPPLNSAHRALNRLLLSRPSPHLTSFALVLLRRPD